MRIGAIILVCENEGTMGWEATMEFHNSWLHPSRYVGMGVNEIILAIVNKRTGPVLTACRSLL